MKARPTDSHRGHSHRLLGLLGIGPGQGHGRRRWGHTGSESRMECRLAKHWKSDFSAQFGAGGPVVSNTGSSSGRGHSGWLEYWVS